ncbi:MULTISPECIES: DNA primase [Methylococcus]|uniref:DNA primase n=1 Tax=Methylococcus capsulatus TaxID=414 RepID=A0ABZ2F6K6_METCP|nr:MULTISPECIES: DNA primase [Methylococcus]MDF9393018.1 DNA primase [Methylococcus capsulatus]
MAGRLPREFIDDLIARIDIVDLIDARVPLKKSGSNFMARCPFHSEKTPSFSVSREKQFYHCFGCGAHGNAISFLMDYERQSFPEAVETLAALAGIDLPKATATPGANPSASLQLQPVYDILERAAGFYVQQLRDHPDAEQAKVYLLKRGLTGEIARHYGLGYAPPGWNNLPADWPRAPLIQSGLIIEKDRSCYDRFRHRIMFPIRDRRGRVIGFGGRTLGEETPKYLNSPETEVFKKGKELYGLHELLESAPRPRRILVVEGYLDVIALAQHGVHDAVATLGTSTSTEHVRLLFRFTREIVFCFDGDTAGRKAAWRALEASLPLLQEGREIRFMHLPTGEDPDSLIRQEGREAFERRIGQSSPCSDYLFRTLQRDLDLRSVEGRATLQKQARELLDRLPVGVFKTLMEQRLSELTGVVNPAPASKPVENRPRHSSGQVRSPSAWRNLVTLLLHQPRLAGLISPEIRAQLTKNPRAGPLIARILEYTDLRKTPTPGMLFEYLRETPEGELARNLLKRGLLTPEEGMEREFVDALDRVGALLRDERLSQLIDKSKVAQLTDSEREELRKLTGGKS